MEQEQEISIFDELEQNARIEYAKADRRFINLFIDGIVVTILFMLFINALDIYNAFHRGAHKIQMLSFRTYYLFYVLYYIAFEGATKGRTIGKYITRTVVVDETLANATFAQIVKRSFCRLIPFDALSMFTGTPWHDSLSRTTVIVKQKRQQ